MHVHITKRYDTQYLYANLRETKSGSGGPRRFAPPPPHPHHNFFFQKDAKWCIRLHFGYKICVVKTLNNRGFSGRNWYSMWINQLMVPVHENQPIDGGSSWESTKWWWKFVRINQLMVAIPEFHPIDGDSSFESTNWWWRFIQGLLGKNEKKLAWSFNFTFRYIDDVFSLNNSRFVDFVYRIYPI